MSTGLVAAAPAIAGPVSAPPAPPRAAPQAAWTLRLALGLGGVLVAGMMSGLNNRVGALTLVDLAGARGLAGDDAHLLGTVYVAAELAAMPVAAWCAGVFSLRRFHLAITALFLVCAVLVPVAPGWGWMVGLRALQGMAGGAMIPLLISAALRFLPASIKLQGLGFYSLTATFSPNLALWLAGAWVDGLADWRLASWQVVPVGLFVLGTVWWGIPQDPPQLGRLRGMDLPALLTGPPGLVLLAFALEEGPRLDWLAAPEIGGMLVAAAALIAAFVVSEWFHPAPFMRIQLLARRNYGLGFPVFIGILVVVIASALLPAVQLAAVQRFRPVQIAQIGLIIGLPQLVLAPLVSWLLTRRWVDARPVVALGLLLIAGSCWLGSGVTSAWMVREFWLVQALQAVGQPLAVVAFLYLAVGITAPHEGPSLSGLINTLKAVATLAGAVLVERLLTVIGAAHLRGLVDRAGLLGHASTAAGLFGHFEGQALTLAVADVYRLAGALALLLIPPALLLRHVPPPRPSNTAKE